MKIEKRKRKPSMSARSADVTELPSAKDISAVPLSVKANLNTAKNIKGVSASGSSDDAPSAKELKLPELEGAKDGKLSPEYLKRLKIRMKNRK